MAEKWLEKYNQNTPKGKPNQEFDVFMKLSGENDFRFDSHKAWDKVSTKLGNTNREKRFFIYQYWKVAAVILFILGISFVLSQINQTSEKWNHVVAENGSQNYILPDGSAVYLAKDAGLSYLEPFENRSIEFKGLGYFDIQKSDAPFTILVGEQKITVLGTAFSVHSNQEIVEIFVEEGTVRFESENDLATVTLNEKLTYHHQDQRIEVQNETDPNILSWKTGQFTFNNTPFSKVASHLERYYSIEFSETEKLKNCTITAKFNQENIHQVLDIIEDILEVDFILTNSKVQTIGKGCN